MPQGFAYIAMHWDELAEHLSGVQHHSAAALASENWSEGYLWWDLSSTQSAGSWDLICRTQV